MKKLIAGILKKALDRGGVELRDEEIETNIETPPSFNMGDYSFPCFFLSKKLKQEPHEIALMIREKIGTPTEDFEDIQTAGPYINFFISKKNLGENLLGEILSKKEKFGMANLGRGKKTMIEFSQANTHKAFHVGHVRGTSFGESLAKILEFCGEKVIRVNYQGDSGMHVAKWIWCYKKYHSKEKLRKDDFWIASIYTDAVKRLEKNKKLQIEVDAINRKLESKEDAELNKLWEKTRKLSLDSFEKIYQQLNTHFDHYFFESEFEKSGKKTAEDLLNKKIAKKSDGAVIMDIEKYNLGVWVLLRKDGTVLYSAKDLALAEKKFSEFKINQSIYVIGAAQSLHMSQLFKTLELMKNGNVKNSKFIPVSEVRLPQGKMSSRSGENILYCDFIKEVVDYAKKEIKKRSPKIPKKELEERAIKISIASIKYSMLKQNNKKNIIFRKEDALNFGGDTGPYIQYSYARAGSILKKSKKITDKENKRKFLAEELEPKEAELLRELSQFPEIVLNSYKNFNPQIIANYSYQLSKIFNEFYHACPVIKSEEKYFRLSLVESFRHVLKNSMNLL